MEQVEVLHRGPTAIHTPHFEVALKQVREQIPGKESALKPVLERNGVWCCFNSFHRKLQTRKVGQDGKIC